MLIWLQCSSILCDVDQVYHSRERRLTCQNMASGHVKVKKGTGHVFYMATPSHATESVDLHMVNWSFIIQVSENDDFMRLKIALCKG